MTLGRIARFPGWIAALALLAATAAWGQAWRPDKVTEFITSSAAGGSNDQVARAMLGPKGMTAARVACWEELFAPMAATDEWKTRLQLQGWDGQFLRIAEFAK